MLENKSYKKSKEQHGYKNSNKVSKVIQDYVSSVFLAAKTVKQQLGYCPYCHNPVFTSQNRFIFQGINYHDRCWVYACKADFISQYTRNPGCLQKYWELEELHAHKRA